MVFWGHNLIIKFQILALKFLLLALEFLILALKFLKNCPKICPNFLSEGAGQPAVTKNRKNIYSLKPWCFTSQVTSCTKFICNH
jgi:hypothetical protein